MQIPDNILKNTEAALALLASAMALSGMLLAWVVYAAVFFSLQDIESAFLPQIDLAISAVQNTQSIILSASQSAGSASQGIESLASALSSYSSSTKSIAGSLSAIAAIPPFSLDSSISSAAQELDNAAGLFSNASGSISDAGNSLLTASSALQQTTDDLEAAKTSLRSAKTGLKSAIGTLHLAAFAASASLSALFFSVILVSLSILLSHYPRLFEKKQKPKKGPFSGCLKSSTKKNPFRRIEKRPRKN